VDFGKDNYQLDPSPLRHLGPLLCLPVQERRLVGCQNPSWYYFSCLYRSHCLLHLEDLEHCEQVQENGRKA